MLLFLSIHGVWVCLSEGFEQIYLKIKQDVWTGNDQQHREWIWPTMIDEFNPGINMVWNVCFGHFNAPIWILGCHPQWRRRWSSFGSTCTAGEGHGSQGPQGPRPRMSFWEDWTKMAFHKPGGWDRNSMEFLSQHNININRTVRSNIPDILEVFDIPINKIEGYLIKMDMLTHMAHMTNNIWWSV